MRNYYKILEIDEVATSEEIQTAYRRLAKLYHPDANPHYVHATEMFKLVNEAYAVLSDSQQRKAYDRRKKNVYEKAADAHEGNTESPANNHSAYHYWDPDDPVIHDDYPSRNFATHLQADNSIPVSFKIMLSLDICLGGFFIHSIGNIDLSSVPNDYYFYGWESWLAHLKAGAALQVISAITSIFQFVLLLFHKNSMFNSILNIFRSPNMDNRLIQTQLILKIIISYCFISPIFGMEAFDLSSKTVVFAFLWHTFVAAYITLRLLSYHMTNKF